MHQSNILWKKKLHINFLHFLFLLVKDPCPPVWKGGNGEVMWRGHGAQENRPDIPVGAIAHHRGTGATRTGVYVAHTYMVRGA